MLAHNFLGCRDTYPPEGCSVLATCAGTRANGHRVHTLEQTDDKQMTRNERICILSGKNNWHEKSSLFNIRFV